MHNKPAQNLVVYNDLLFPSILWVNNLDRFLLLHVVLPGITHSAASQLTTGSSRQYKPSLNCLVPNFISTCPLHITGLGFLTAQVVSRYLDFLHGHWLSHSRNKSCCSPLKVRPKTSTGSLSPAWVIWFCCPSWSICL